jgi:hypothetical protein
MRHLILVATLLVAGFVGLHSASATQAGGHAVATAAHAAVASRVSPMCGAIPTGC